MWGDPNQQEQEKGDRFSAEDAENRVLIVRPVEYIPDMPMRDTRGDAVRVNVVDLNENPAVQYNGALWFSGRLIKAFKGAIGTPFLGYISKERLPNGYRGWTFNSLAGNEDWERVAQAWLAVNPEFLAPLPQPDHFSGPTPAPGSWHEQGPAPEWAGAVPPRPPAPPAPPARPMSGPPAPPARPMSGPPAPPAPRPVSGPPVSGESMLERLARQAAQPTPYTSNVPSGDQEPPY